MADTYVQEFDDLASAFNSAWGDDIRVAWPNIIFEPRPDESWVRFTVITGEAQQVTTGCPGANVVRYQGIVDIQVFTPRGGGTATANAMADKAIAIFDTLDIAGYHFNRGYKVNVAGNSKDTFFQMNVRIPFQRDSLK